MTDAVITEHTGSRHGPVVRCYQYGNGGVHVLDAKKALKRQYLFDPSSDIMTECDPSRQDRILRRFVFDNYGMIEETFAFGRRPRTFRYEAGGQRIAVREGGEYGAVGKLFTFEENGVSETGWGRNGEIERVFVFEAGDDAITERAGGWFGNLERIIVFEGINASLFREPEAFLQFLMFTEWSDSDRESQISDEVEKIRAWEPGAAGARPYAYTGPRHMTEDAGEARARGPVPRVPARNGNGRPARASRSGSDDGGIDFIPDADAPPSTVPRGPPARRSDDIPFGERLGRVDRETGLPSAGRSAEIPIQERFERARQEREPLSKGRSVEIPLDERFGSSREKEQLSRGGSVDIPLEERFEDSRREREKVSKGKSAEIPYSERRGGGDR